MPLEAKKTLLVEADLVAMEVLKFMSWCHILESLLQAYDFLLILTLLKDD